MCVCVYVCMHVCVSVRVCAFLYVSVCLFVSSGHVTCGVIVLSFPLEIIIFSSCCGEPLQTRHIAAPLQF